MSIKNAKQLRELLTEDYLNTSSGDKTPAAGNACANIAGKILQSCKLELEYAVSKGESPNITFLDGKE